MVDCKPCATPMTPATKLSKEGGVLFDDPTMYRSTVGALQYLTITRPDIAYSVNKLSQFLAAPTTLHWTACKRLLRYLKGTASLRLSFKPSATSQIIGYSDADWAGSVDDRRSTGGHCIYLGSNLITWSAKKQDVVSRSSAESEYRSLANATTDIVWLHALCSELGLTLQSPSKLWCDNISALALAGNPVFHTRTKHIEVDIHYIRDKIKDGTIEVGYVPSNDQIADLLTKPLADTRFCALRDKLNLLP
ncbi:secreted RxLR effector protein 161-like [Salvia miltiorrhiza]|uniref:secreted RxLR effector protein 161-like n=1 Tax=Salvia miltiorrhiza TaxID=226208 RepID=UPI0025AC771A|nr:secreted RxLR effector protein 161-like [Salvia miltiorrhiza]XP_057803017.1 secreted RxLR effector protein 161-like [Salvia miltiorrhiza]